MKRARLKVTRAARRDLVEIGRYTLREWGEAQCRSYLTQLDDRLRLLAAAPTSGRSCDDIKPGYWRYREGRHVVFYRLVGDTIEVVRILHERMLPKRHL